MQKDKKQKIKASNHDSYGVLTLVSLLIPVVGVILGIVYLTKEQIVDRKLGEHLIAVSVFASIVFSIVWVTFVQPSFTRPLTSTDLLIDSAPDLPEEPTWNIEESYKSISKGMSRSEVEAVIGKTSTDCIEQEINESQYDACSYGDILEGGSISVSYIDGIVSDKSKLVY